MTNKTKVNLPYEIIDYILIYTNDVDLCIQLKRFYPLIKLNYTIDKASKNGHLDVVKYLHSINKDCTVDAMDFASKNGHLDVVKYLHSINKDCTVEAVNWASMNGHLDVVKYLNRNIWLGKISHLFYYKFNQKYI